MSDYLDEMGKQESIMSDLAYRLNALSNAFYLTGNDSLGLTLESYSCELFACEEAVRRAVGEEINDHYQQTMQSSANMLNACLADTKIGRESAE